MNRRMIKYTGLCLLILCGLIPVVLAARGCEEKQTHKPVETTAPVKAAARAVESNQEMEAETHLPIVALEDIKALIAETAERDQVLVIDFWATWCVPCVEMFPSLHEGLVARGEAVRALTVTLDDPSREASAVAFLVEHDALHDAYIFKNDSAAQQALADGLGEKWDSLAVPAILVYDTRGRLVGEFLEGGSTVAILDRVDGLLASDVETRP